MKKIFFTLIAFSFLFLNFSNFAYATYPPINKCWEDLTTNKTYTIDDLASADRNTLEEIIVSYLKDKDNVYYMCKILKDADPETFDYIMNGYSKDKDNVFFYNQKVKNADPKTFEVLSKRTFYNAKDKNHKYQNGEKMNLRTIFKDIYYSIIY